MMSYTLEKMSEGCAWHQFIHYALTLILNDEEVDTETCLIDSVHIFKVGELMLDVQLHA